MFRALPDGFTPVRTVEDDVQYWGSEYRICEVHIVRDRDGRFYIRRYENEVGTGPNGRPGLHIKEEYVPVEEPDSVTESNWLNYCFFTPEAIVLCERNETAVDTEAWKYAQQTAKNRKEYHGGYLEDCVRKGSNSGRKRNKTARCCKH